jgi:hypothetical protein
MGARNSKSQYTKDYTINYGFKILSNNNKHRNYGYYRLNMETLHECIYKFIQNINLYLLDVLMSASKNDTNLMLIFSDYNNMSKTHKYQESNNNLILIQFNFKTSSITIIPTHIELNMSIVGIICNAIYICLFTEIHKYICD